MTTNPEASPRDRLFALIASIPGSGSVDWCDEARALLDEIAAPAPPVSSAVPDHTLRDRVAETLDSLQGTAHHLPPETRKRVEEALTAALAPLLPTAADWDALVTETDRLRRESGTLHGRAVELDAQVAALQQQAPADRATVLREAAELVRAMAPEHPTNAAWVQDCHTIADRIAETACPVPESHNWGCGCPTDRINLHAENGIDTPGCDCGHDGMGLRWHSEACAWVVGLLAEARELLATEDDAELRRLAAEAQPGETEALWDELHRRDNETDQPHAAEAHPSHDGWLVEMRMDDGGWAVALPTDDEAAARARLTRDRSEFPGEEWRLVRHTETYTVVDPPAAGVRQPDTETRVRAAIYREAADELDSISAQFDADSCDCGNCALCAWKDAARHLRRLANGSQPEAPWTTDGARIGRVLIWSHADIGNGDFGRGYRAAQEEARAILTRPLLGAEAQPEPEVQQAERPRCPHCQMPHDLTPGSMGARACEMVRADIVDAKRRHAEGDHGRCALVDCDAVRATRTAERAPRVPQPDVDPCPPGCIACATDESHDPASTAVSGRPAADASGEETP